ncbi:MAG: glucose-1-phosphate thymidylyltransferase, partial [Cyclobacteriaceae bacterium]|nr:glucose-1-phosphate thymidylyltransferase [Cyclobacteriaceae bacterium]
QLMIDKGEKFSTFNVDGWYDCGKPETLLSTNRFILSQNGNQPEVEGVVINPPVYVAPSAKITNSVIGPYATICEDCEITDSTIQNSIIYEKSIIKNIKLTDSIIGTEANVIGNGNSQKLNIGDTSEIEFIND